MGEMETERNEAAAARKAGNFFRADKNFKRFRVIMDVELLDVARELTRLDALLLDRVIMNRLFHPVNKAHDLFSMLSFPYIAFGRRDRIVDISLSTNTYRQVQLGQLWNFRYWHFCRVIWT